MNVIHLLNSNIDFMVKHSELPYTMNNSKNVNYELEYLLGKTPQLKDKYDVCLFANNLYRYFGKTIVANDCIMILKYDNDKTIILKNEIYVNNLVQNNSLPNTITIQKIDDNTSDKIEHFNNDNCSYFQYFLIIIIILSLWHLM